MPRQNRKVGLFARAAVLAMGLLFNLGAVGCQVAARPDDTRDAESMNIDPEIASLLRAANEAELELAQLGRARATDTNVRELASALEDKHQALLQRQSNLGIAPVDNTSSQQLRSESDKRLAALETLRGNAFDNAYLEAQAQTQSRLYTMLDQQLIPKAQSDQLRADLLQMREEVGAQLRRAQELQAFSPPSSD